MLQCTSAEGDGKNRRSNLAQKRAAIDSCDSRHAAKDGVLAKLQIVRVKPLGETLQRTILSFEAPRREEVLRGLVEFCKRPIRSHGDSAYFAERNAYYAN